MFSSLYIQQLLSQANFTVFIFSRSLRSERSSVVRWVKALRRKHLESLTKSTQITPKETKSNAKTSDDFHQSSSRRNDLQMTVEDQFEKLASVVTPLSTMSYVDQLQMKWNRNRKLLLELGKKMKQANSPCKFTNRLPCALHDIIPSPVENEYRNKDEFKVKPGVDGNPKTVGLIVGSLSEQNFFCVNPDHLINTKRSHKLVAKCFEEYIRKSPLPICDLFTDGGNWRGITVRSNLLGHAMATVIMHPQKLSEKELEKEKELLADYFTSGHGADCNLKSLYFQACHLTRCDSEQAPYHHLLGEKYIYEEILGVKFRISPDSFFQVNTSAAEYLFKAILKLGSFDTDTVVLDVCSGVGVIGLIVASHVRTVVGIELNKQAVSDSVVNAEINNVNNCTFLHGRVEWILPDLISSLQNYKLVAVLNPARGGIRSDVLRALRSCSRLHQIIYISCKPDGEASQNLLYLTKPKSSKLPGDPFIPKLAVPLDMFPHTEHCELIIVLDRRNE